MRRRRGAGRRRPRRRRPGPTPIPRPSRSTVECPGGLLACPGGRVPTGLAGLVCGGVAGGGLLPVWVAGLPGCRAAGAPIRVRPGRLAWACPEGLGWVGTGLPGVWLPGCRGVCASLLVALLLAPGSVGWVLLGAVRVPCGRPCPWFGWVGVGRGSWFEECGCLAA